MLISSDSSSSVHKVRSAQSQDKYDLLRVINTESDISLIRQYSILKKLDLPGHIPKVFELTDYDNQPALRMEFMPGVSLADYIDGVDPVDLDDNEKLEVALQLLKIVRYLIDRKVSHKDIKPGNLVYDRGIKKLALIDCEFVNRKTICGTKEYMPWELFYEKPKRFTPGHDIYSAILTINELATGYILSVNQLYREFADAITSEVSSALHQICYQLDQALMVTGDSRLEVFVSVSDRILLELSGDSGSTLSCDSDSSLPPDNV